MFSFVWVCEMVTTVKLITTSLTWQSYHFCFVVRIQDLCLRKFQVFIVALLTILTMLNNRTLWLINLITRSLYWWKKFSHIEVWGSHSGLCIIHLELWANQNSLFVAHLFEPLKKRKHLKSNGVTVIQASKMEVGGHGGRVSDTFLYHWECEYSELYHSHDITSCSR